MQNSTWIMLIIAALCGNGQVETGTVDAEATGNNETLPADPTGRLTEESLGQVCDNKIRRALSLYRDAYRLSEAQALAFQDRMHALKVDQIRYTLTTLEERNRLSEEAAADLRTRQRGQHPSPAYFNAMAALKALNAGNPLFDESNVQRELEAMLPPDQAKQGRIRLDDIRKKSFDRNAAVHILSATQRDGSKRLVLSHKDGWEAYVKQFCVRFQLTDAQSSSAQSSLRDAIELRDEFMRIHKQEWEEILARQRQPSDPVLDELEAIWQRLLSHLDQIPTAEQVARVHAASLRPNLLVTATRPTDYTEGVKGRRADAPATQPHPASANDEQTIIEPTMDAAAAASASQPAP